jgi:hypothetical protein
MITKDDLRLIKEYNKKDNEVNEYINLPTDSFKKNRHYITNEDDSELIGTFKTKQNFEHDNDLIDFKSSPFPMSQIVDPRLNRINQKIKREKDANKYRHNVTNLQRSYDMYSRDFSSTTSKDFENEFNLDNIRDDLSRIEDHEYEANSKFNTHELVNPPSQHQYNVPPSIAYKQQLHYQRDDSQNSQQDLLGSGFTYRKAKIPNFENQHKFDLDSRMSIAAMNCRKESAENLYSGVAELTGGPLKNIDYENYIKYGYPTSKARSLGFENPFENQFQYIDSDIQNPDHCVFDRPTATRLDNRVMARPKKRDIY